MFWIKIVENFWWLMIFLFFVAPVFNGGWILRVLIIGIFVAAFIMASVLNDKSNSY